MDATGRQGRDSQEAGQDEPDEPQRESRLPWQPVRDEFEQVVDWRCPACKILIHLASSGRAICPKCGRSAREAVPRTEPVRNPGDPSLRRFLKAMKHKE